METVDDTEIMDAAREGKELSNRELAFIYAYLTEGMNASRAYRVINPGLSDKSNQQSGWQIYNRPRVKEKIREIVEERAMPAYEVLAHIADIARASIGDCFRYDSVRRSIVFDPALAYETGAIHQIKSLKRGEDGTMTVTLHDKMAALTTLANVHGLLSKTDGDGEGANTQVIVYVPENSRDKR